MTGLRCRNRRGVGLGSLFGILALLFAPALIAPAAAAAAPAAAPAATAPVAESEYVIGAGDALQIFVWHNADLTAHVPVRPDGRISIPLVEDIPCAGKTPTELARDIEERLKKYVQDPTVTVIVDSFVGLPSQQIRVVGPGDPAESASLSGRDDGSGRDDCRGRADAICRRESDQVDAVCEWTAGDNDPQAGRPAAGCRSFGECASAARGHHHDPAVVLLIDANPAPAEWPGSNPAASGTRAFTSHAACCASR